MLIQQKWREHRARCLEAQVSRAEEHERALAEAETEKEHTLTPEELNYLLPLPEPQRCFEWYVFTTRYARLSFDVVNFQDQDYV